MSLEFIAGCLGGCAGVAVGHPFDTIKVRLQTQDAKNPRFRGTWHCIVDTVKNESVRGLYRGMASPMAGVGFINALIFGVHGNIMKRMKDPDLISSHGLAGAVTGFSQAFIVSPMEMIKTRLQVQTNGKYKGPLHCLKLIARTEGLRGIFKGQRITIMREVPAFAAYFSSYEYLVRTMSNHSREPSAAAILLSGGLAGTASWVLTFPIDVLKSRIQIDGMNGANKYKGIVHCLKTSLRQEGRSFLTRGLSSTILRSFPSNAATFYVVSGVIKVGVQLEDKFEGADTWQEVLRRGEILIGERVNPYMKELVQQQKKMMQLRDEIAMALNFEETRYEFI